MSVDRQYIWLVRYGRTFPGLIENVGNYDSDLHQPEGMEHAQAVADKIQKTTLEWKSSTNQRRSITYHIISDPFLRCMRTADIIARQLDIQIKVEEGTTEWQVPSLLVDSNGQRTYPRSIPQLEQSLNVDGKEKNRIDTTYTSVNPQGPDRNETDTAANVTMGCPQFPETEEQLHIRCRTTIQRLVQKLDRNQSMIIVGHAPCVQSMAMALEGCTSPNESKFVGPWSLGGMTLFSRCGSNIHDKWTMEFFNDTSHMPGEYKHGQMGQWSLPSFVRNTRQDNEDEKKV